VRVTGSVPPGSRLRAASLTPRSARRWLPCLRALRLVLALSLGAQFSYRMADAHLLWAALFAWYVVFGAGPISIDAAIARGLCNSAFPFADRAVVLAETDIAA
jgi:hypothetical protein